MPSAFPKLDKAEIKMEWGKEFILGQAFIEEVDLYRAITCYKRALFLIPSQNVVRKRQIEFCLMQAYFFGDKYKEALNVYDGSSLRDSPGDFPAMPELLIMLYHCYEENNEPEKAERIQQLMLKQNPRLSDDVELSEAVIEGDLCTLTTSDWPCERQQPLNLFLEDYETERLSVRKAQVLNGVLPGAGYFYVGLKKTALTSFLINSIFIAASYQFFHKGYPALGIFTTSLEFGWYFGGINGAGLAANEYNERLYERKAKDFLIEQRLFPILMFSHAF